MKQEKEYLKKNNKRVEHTELVIEDNTIYEIDLECVPCKNCDEEEEQ